MKWQNNRDENINDAIFDNFFAYTSTIKGLLHN